MSNTQSWKDLPQRYSMELKDGHVTAPRLLQELSGLKLFGNILEVLKTKLRAVVEPGP